MKAKKFSKRIIASVLTLMLAVGCFIIPSTVVGAANEVTVNFHYLRDDGNYDQWGLWAWGEGKDGASYDFVDNGDAKGAVTTVTLTESTPSLGFIVKKGNWLAKDPEADRYLDLSAVVSGTVEVYCETGKEEFDVNLDNAVLGLKIKNPKAVSKTEIEFSFTVAPEEGEVSVSDFAVLNGLGEPLQIASLSHTDGSKEGKLTLYDELDYAKEYTVEFQGSSTSLSLPDYFSSEEFESQYTYDGNDLGATYTKEKTTFRVWAPTANQIELNIYDEGNGGNATEVVPLTADVNGTWVAVVNGDLNKKYYTYTAYFDGKTNKDIVDPYAKSVGVNGKRGQILDLDETDPDGWSSDARHTYANITDMSLYELHIRDFSADPDSGITNKGKYLAFTETGTTTSNGIATGIDHLKDLGITTVHIMPSYDFGSVDETKLDTPQYNWGYDPVNYNAPEGSYSTDPYHGEVRVNEYKQMVKSLHDAGIGVVMDVVYNHTYTSDSYCFNQLVPGYFHRPDSNGSGCGNDVASERLMVRKYIVESVKYWAEEYHLDGFRFDLMGLIDVDTMNEIRAELDKIDPNIIIYGEGWTLSTNVTKDVKLATQTNASLTPGIAYFSDNIRDALRGNVFEDTEPGYVAAEGKNFSSIKKSVNYSSVWSPSPSQTINYDSCHDNHTVWDRLANTAPEATEEERISMNKLSAAIVFTSQGVPFIMSGEEFLRTKGGDHNSYASPDSVNQLDYTRVGTYSNVYNYYKGLITLRNAFDGFRLTTADEVAASIEFAKTADKQSIAYTIAGSSVPGDSAKHDIFVIYNPFSETKTFDLPEGKWSIVANGDQAGIAVLGTAEGTVDVSAISAFVLVKDYTEPVEPVNPTNPTNPTNPDPANPNSGNNTDPGTIVPPADNNNNNSDSGNNNDNGSGEPTDTTTYPTGDSTTAVIFIAIAAAAGFTAIVFFKRRKRSER